MIILTRRSILRLLKICTDETICSKLSQNRIDRTVRHLYFACKRICKIVAVTVARLEKSKNAQIQNTFLELIVHSASSVSSIYQNVKYLPDTISYSTVLFIVQY